MRILFLCTGNEFTPDMKYKENYHIRAAIENHDKVWVIASTKTYVDGKKVYLQKGIYRENKYSVLRLNNMNFFGRMLSDKLRCIPNLKKHILKIKPDILYYNCPQVWNVNDLKVIRRYLPNCLVIWDFSTWYGNSGQNWISLNILHKGIYRYWLKKNERYVDKIYYTSYDPYKFICEVYNLDKSKMKLSDLPSEILSDYELSIQRKQFRIKYSIDEDAVIFVHTGKMGRLKRTEDIVRCFNKFSENYNTYLYIIGSFENDVRNKIMEIINKNEKIRYLGFLNAEDMLRIISGCDIYLQPGSTSHTFQEAVCRGCIPIFAERKYDAELVGNCGVELKKISELKKCMKEFVKHPEIIPEMKKGLLKRVRNRLDYRMIYQRMIDHSELQ